MKTNKDFNLSKGSKRMLATVPTSTRGHWKSMMIEAEVMALFVEVDSTDKGCKVILNMDEVMEVAPMASGGCHLFLSDGRIYKVKDNYTLFQQFAMQTVSADDIAARVKSLKKQASGSSIAMEIPKL